ncbi:MAG: hypothetical protein MK102_18310 [Fuerstiella sp.]|nr:hypothetical protein [Fuerstiella sp.]
MFNYRTDFTEKDGMDEKGAKIFLAAARMFDVTIMVRAMNPGSLRYLGQPGFQPKLPDCPPRIAENATNSGLEGLVVSPCARPQCFPDNIGDARKTYEKFVLSQHATESNYIEAQTRLQKQKSSSSVGVVSDGSSPDLDARLNVCYEAGISPYGVETKGRYKGAVKYRGSLLMTPRYVCGGWSLKDIFRTPGELWESALREDRWVRTHLDGQSRTTDDGVQESAFSCERSLGTGTAVHFMPVAQFVNNAYNCQAINHGEEARVSDHSDDKIFVFPNGKLITFQLQTLMGRYDRQHAGARHQYLPDCFFVTGHSNIREIYDVIGRNLTGRFTLPHPASPFEEPVYDPAGRCLPGGLR